MPNAHIIGLGHYVPEKKVTNEDLSKLMDTSDKWILDRTGMQERRFAKQGEGPSDLAIPATEQALEASGLQVNDIDFIIRKTIYS